MRDIFKIQEAIECQRNKVNKMADSRNIDDEMFVRENHKLDQLIEEYIKAVQEISHSDKKLYKHQYKSI